MPHCSFKIPKCSKKAGKKFEKTVSTLKDLNLKSSNCIFRINETKTELAQKRNIQKKIKPNELEKSKIVKSENSFGSWGYFESQQRVLNEVKSANFSKRIEEKGDTCGESLLVNIRDQNNVKHQQKSKENMFSSNEIIRKLNSHSYSEEACDISQNLVKKVKKCKQESENKKNLNILPHKRQAEEIDENKPALVQCNSLKVIEILVYWNPKWLEEQKYNFYPPPLIEKETAEAGLCCGSCKSYSSSIYHMLILEIWKLMYEEAYFILGSNYTNCNRFYCRVSSFLNEGSMMVLRCEAVVSQRLPVAPLEGTVMLLNVQNQKTNIDNFVFGYVTWHELEFYTELAPEWKQVPLDWLRDSKMCFFTVYIKRKPNLDLKSLMLAHGICNIKYEFSLINCLRKFKLSPLSGLSVLCNRTQSNPKETSPESMSQKFVNLVCSGCGIFEKNVPKLYMLQGPPGSGKTSIILEILQKVFYKSTSRFKFLVCVSSSSEEREIEKRLLRLRKLHLGKSPILKFVLMTDFVKNVEAAPKFSINLKRKQRMIEERLNNLESEIICLVEEKSQSRQGMDSETRLENLRDQHDNLKQELLLSTPLHDDFKDLDESDVIVSTVDLFQILVSSYLSRQKVSTVPTCCIVDEANLCTDSELLQYFSRGVSQLILISDSRFPVMAQNDKTPKHFSQKRSMFERFHSFFKNHPHSPIFTLKEQYRMHSEICKFPSEYFYENQMWTSTETEAREQYLHIKPYLVFDIKEKYSLCSNQHDISQLLGHVSLFSSKCTSILSVGIITDEYSVPFFRRCISLYPKGKSIKVSTVDGFRGQEKDVIVAIFFRTPGSLNLFNELVADEERLKVILTRARRSLFLFGHLSSLRCFKHWEALLNDARSRNVYIYLSSLNRMPEFFL